MTLCLDTGNLPQVYIIGVMQDLWPNSYFHNLSPFLIQFSENFGIRWYGLSYLLGFFLGYRFILWLSRRGLTALRPEQAADFVFCVALGTVIGGRLGYCVFYSPELLMHFEASFPFWGVLAINKGGMASHGGIIGIFLATLIFARRHRLPFLQLLDLNTIGGTLGIFFGRIANFINSELVGRQAPPGLPWAVKFPKDILHWGTDDPTRLPYLGPAAEHLGISSQKWQELLATRGLPGNQLDRVLEAIVQRVESGDPIIKGLIAPYLVGRHPSQLYAALLEGGLIFIILFLAWMRPRKPGVVAGLFLTIYPIVRIFGEQFRMPDPGIGFQLWGLTRGQWLSVIMIALTLGLLIYWSTRKTELVGGWGKNGHSE